MQKTFSSFLFLMIAMFFTLTACNLPITETPQATFVATLPTETKIPPTYTHVVPPTFTPTPGVGSTMISDKDGMILVYVPEGNFTMGSLTVADEQPVHEVNLDAFWIDQTEITNAMYAKCVSAGGCKQPDSISSSTHKKYYGAPEFDNYPVIYVDWNMAKAYCGWAIRKLPTEAQWEKAARGTTGNIYPWGNDFDGTKVNFCDTNCSYKWSNKSFNDGFADVSPVGNYPSGQSVYGALDMAGNVWEWINDMYSDIYYENSPSSNPLGPDYAPYQALRGGSWYSGASYTRAAGRNSDAAVDASSIIGFRCSALP